MPQSGGPNTVNDSIVFNYDTGDNILKVSCFQTNEEAANFYMKTN